MTTRKDSLDETPMNRHAREYMAKKMAMTEPYEDQEQHWILSHLAAFGHELLKHHGIKAWV